MSLDSFRPSFESQNRDPRVPPFAAQRLKLAQSINNPQAAPLQRELAGETFGAWNRGAQERMAKSNCMQVLDDAERAVSNLPENSAMKDWTGKLKFLRTLATKRNSNESTGDPLAILRYRANIQPELHGLKTIAAVDPAMHDAVTKIENAFDAFALAIGEAHHAVSVSPAVTGKDSRLREIGGVMLFAGAATAALAAGVVTFFSKDEDRNGMLVGMPLLIAGLAAGWGNLNMTGTEHMGKEVGWLIENEWNRLQSIYGLRGQDWATFIESYAADGPRNPVIVAALKSKVPLTKEQRDAILALAPQSIHSPIKAMLDSKLESVHAADFKSMVGLTQRASSPDAQRIMLQYVRTGATLQSVQAAAGRG